MLTSMYFLPFLALFLPTEFADSPPHNYSTQIPGTYFPIEKISSDHARDDCFSISYGLAFCGVQFGWKPFESEHKFTAAYKRNDEKFAIFIIQEKVDRELDLAMLGVNIILNAANGMGVRDVDVKIYSVNRVDFYGKRAARIAFRFENYGNNYTFVNTFWLDDGIPRQIYTYQLSDDFREADLTLHKDVVDNLMFSATSQ